MDELNYHHLHYFWMVAREGSIAKACARLGLSQPTISAQLKRLETALGQRVFRRAGRHLTLTDFGRRVFRYAEQIFTLGEELVDVVNGRPGAAAPRRLAVGAPPHWPQSLLSRLLAPALHTGAPLHLTCRTGALTDLLAELAVERLDLVLTDQPLPATAHVRAFTHALGECDAVVVGTAELVQRALRSFPRSLHGAAWLAPAAGTPLRTQLDAWFHARQLTPLVTAEFESADLLFDFGRRGSGLFVWPSVLDAELGRAGGLATVGRLSDLRLGHFAVTVERQPQHPGVVAVIDAAREGLFAAPAPTAAAPARTRRRA